MKKLLTLVFLLIYIIICMGTISESQQVKKAPIEYQGFALFSKNIFMPDAYKQHVLLKKAKQWIIKNCSNDTIMVVGESINIENQDYNLLLKFTDGEINFRFTSNLKDKKKLALTGQQLMDRLTGYVRICELNDKSY